MIRAAQSCSGLFARQTRLYVVALKGGYIGAGYLGRLVGDEGYILRDGVLVSDQ